MICPNCKQELTKINNSYVCKNNHCFDISKYGYINLLLNGKNSGDNKEMINSRYQFLNKGYYSKLRDSIIEVIKPLKIQNILDIGCGEGYYDRGIVEELNISLIGLDISKEAIIKASKLNKEILYIVGNVNDLPFSNGEFDLILNIFAPHNEKEFSRVCNNYILKVIPNSNHLIELKELLYENVIVKDEKKLNIPGFKEVQCKNIVYKVIIEDLFELFKMTPYYYKTKYNMETFERNKNKLITCDFTLVLYQKELNN